MKRILFFLTTFICFSSFIHAFNSTLEIPDTGWRLWLDRNAKWKSDLIYLPNEFDIKKLVPSAPSNGWEFLNNTNGIPVSLPSTVEEHFWGVEGFRAYKDEYFYENQDTIVKNGNYLGVSWWWCNVEIPKDIKFKKAILHIRGARLRAEVYWNRKLVGYNIINEVSFTCDITEAIRSDETNQLAIRITNPGGRMDWLDTQLMTWGTTDQRFHKSHGFGGLDRGIFLTFHDDVYFSDLWVLNTPDIKSVSANVILNNISDKKIKGILTVNILDPDDNNNLCNSISNEIEILPETKKEFRVPIDYKSAKIWSLETPKLYILKATFSNKKSTDTRELRFGFRWFTAEGIGNDALLRLNGQRIRLTSAISWGFWGRNGLFPTHELAEREIKAAKTLGMNCIQFHRNVGKSEVLDLQDQMGLYRYMEPGGGQTALGEKYSLYAPSPSDYVDPSGKGGEPSTFAEKYMEEKIIRMIRDHRSHPSLLLWCIQNEMHPDLHNPRIFYLIKRMQKEDPSRIIVLKSGFPTGTPSVNQVWVLPYDTTIYYDKGDGYSGWWDDHTVGGPGVWRDEMYRGPENFTHRSENKKEIVMWGEMLGAAVPDNHETIVQEIKESSGNSYDLAEHQEILNSYNKFLDRWGFRKAFPTAGALFTAIGDKSYDFWGRVIETARLSEVNDYHVISGWESTSIENHSGLVDNMRNFKGNPSLIRKRLEPLRPVIKFHSLIVEKDSCTKFDLYLLNETHTPHGDRVNVWYKLPSGRRIDIGTFNVPQFTSDKFVYPIKMNVRSQPLTEEGEIIFYVEYSDKQNLITEEKIWVLNCRGEGALPERIGIISNQKSLLHEFELFPGCAVTPYKKNKKYDAFLIASRIIQPLESRVESTRVIKGTEDPELYRTIHYGSPENFDYIFSNLPSGEAKVTLKFAELFHNAPNVRIFDVAINGKIILSRFDVFTSAGGMNIAFDTTVTTRITDGIIQITIPHVYAGSARICGIKILNGDTTIAINCGGKLYRDKNGMEWRPYSPQIYIDNDIIEKVKNGTPLIVLAEGGIAVQQCAEFLAREGAFNYYGHLGEARASWMGSWYFVRKHELYNGMPVNCAMGSYYQVPVTNADGVIIEGSDVDIAAGYSRDHDRMIGAGSLTARLGEGKIIFHTIPGVVSGLNGNSLGMHSLLIKRLITNSLIYAVN